MFALLAHFSLVAIYANPLKTDKKKWDYYAQWYTYPYFDQNWNLFVPPPNTNYKLFVEYEDNGTHRADIFEEILIQHQSNRFKGYELFVIAFTNSIHYFEKSTQQLKALNGPINNDINFKLVENSALKYLQHTRHIKLSKIKLRLLVQTLDSKLDRVYFN